MKLEIVDSKPVIMSAAEQPSVNIIEVQSFTDISTRDAMRKRGLCCRPLSVRLSLAFCINVTYNVTLMQKAKDIAKHLYWPDNYNSRHSAGTLNTGCANKKKK